MKLLVVTTFDSQLKVASYIAEEFLTNSWNVDFRIPRIGKKQMSSQQVKDFSSFDEFSYCSYNPSSILEGCENYNAILLIVDGNLIQSVCSSFYEMVEKENLHPRPVMITGFVGVGLFDTVVGYQRRLNSDVLFLNSKKDFDDCLAVSQMLGLNGDNMIISGMPIVGNISREFSVPKKIDTVLFAGQPDVPRRIIERIYVLEKMVDYARRFPERRVLFKPRHRPNENSLHKTKYHYQALLKTYLKGQDIPENFEIIYEPIQELLEDVQLFITVTSTAAIEAMAYNCNVALVLDLGISEKLGNHFFMGSGMLVNFKDLFEENYSLPNISWLENNVEFGGNGINKIYQKTYSLVQRQEEERLPIRKMDKLIEMVDCRNEIEERNNVLVRNVPKTLFFFMKRFLMSR